MKLKYIAPFLLGVFLIGCGQKTDMINQALELAGQGQLAEAETALLEAQKNKEDEQLFYRAAGIIEMYKGDYEAAAGNLEKSLTLSNGNLSEKEFDTAYYLLTAQHRLGRTEDAIKTATAIIDLRPKDSNACYIRGVLQLDTGNYDDAVRDFNLAVDNDAKNPDIYLKIYETMEGAGYEEQGSEYLSEVAALDVKLTDFQKGRLYYYQNDYEGARTALEKARNDESGGTILYLGRTYEALGDLNFAASLYNSQLEKTPEDAVVWNQLGMCEMRLADYEKACAAFERSLAGTGDINRQTVKFNEITAYEYRGDFNRAAALMDEYIAAYPSDTEALREYKFLMSSRTDIEPVITEETEEENEVSSNGMEQ